MCFFVLSRHVGVSSKTFTPNYVLISTGLLMRKVVPSLWGGKSSCPGLNGAGRSLEESCCRWSVPEQRNATCLKCYPVCCNDVAWSTPAPHHRPRRQPKQQRFWKDQISPSQLSSFFAPRFLRHGLFFFHSLTSCSLNPPFLCRGVVFRSPPATRGRPRWPTEGGRGKGTERPLVAKDRLWLWKITFPLSSTKWNYGR